MAHLYELEGQVLDCLEESRTSPKFWSTQYEIRTALVEAANELTLISGLPEVRRTDPFAIAANTTIFTLPSDAMALLKIEAGDGYVQKAFVWDLDTLIPNWENATGAAIKRWFPFGLGKFGIYPKLTDPVNVALVYIAQPVNATRPYNGSEDIPFQDEYNDAMIGYAEHVCRLKEGGVDFFQSVPQYDEFLRYAARLSDFGDRKGSLRFTKFGGVAAVTAEVEKR